MGARSSRQTTYVPPLTPARPRRTIAAGRARAVAKGSAMGNYPILAAAIPVLVAVGVACGGGDGGPGLGVVGLGTGVASAAAGSHHTCALTEDGGVKCWGENHFGQLGDGTTERRVAPVDVVGLSHGVIAIAAGGGQSCAITSERRLKCWGGYDYHVSDNQLASERNIEPVDVPGFEGGVKAIALGGSGDACAVGSDGSVTCWGNERRSEQVSVFGLRVPTVAIAAGGFHACAAVKDGQVACWGRNTVGQTGSLPEPWNARDGQAIGRYVSGVREVVDIAAGHVYTCALLADGAVMCWGKISFGFGDESILEDSGLPKPVAGLSGPARSIVAGSMHACAMTDRGVECWGSNVDGQLGGTSHRGDTPVVIGLKGAKSVAAGNRHTCAVTAEGGVKCWGNNSIGQLGTGEVGRP
jgi:alpha-tubulin suppressor-like RCC1 family protein